MAGSGKPYESIQTVRVPFIGNPNNRDTVTSRDQRFVNAYFDVLQSTDGNKSYYMVKRPGYTQRIQPSGTTGVGRGIYSWKGDLYSVIGTQIYKNTTNLGVTLTTSTGKCGIAETHPIAVTQYLCINDGVRLYCIAATTGVVTTVTLNFPNPNTTDLVPMDTYLFTLDNKGTIWQCNTNDPTTWDNTKFITAQMYNGVGNGLVHQNNIIYYFSDKHFQGFYDAANSTGSVLSNVEQVAQQIGCASQNSIVSDETMILWVSNSNRGGYSVMKLDGAQGGVQVVSTPGIERILKGENTSISSCLGNWIRLGGHKFYVLNLIGQDRTLVYDIYSDMWLEWQAAGSSGRFPLVSYTQFNNALVGQHATNGWLYTLSEGTFQDDTTNFTVLGRFKMLDFDDFRRKFCHRATIICDAATNDIVQLQYSDDDFQTLSAARSLNMSATPQPYATSLGNFRRRSWQISYTGPQFLRLEALELKLRLGQQ
jgi:hypothetical protein